MKNRKQSLDTNKTAQTVNEFPREIFKNEKKRIRNLYFSILSTGFTVLASTTTLGLMLDNYIHLNFENQNTWVGTITMSMGLTTMFFFLPIGFAVDMCDRIFLAKISGLLVFLSGLIGVYSIWYDNSFGLIIYVCTSQLSYELGSSNNKALFNGNLKKSETDRYFAMNGVVMALFGMLGPVISFFFFYIFGDVWDLNVVKPLLLLLIIFTRLTSTTIHFLYQKIDINLITQTPEQLADFIEQDTIETEISSDSQPSSPSVSTHTNSLGQIENDIYDEKAQLLKTNAKYIPYIMITQDLIRAMGAGMLVKFAPFFLVQELGLTPFKMNLLNLGFSFTLIVCTYFGKNLIGVLGKPFSSFTYSFFAILMLHSLSYMTDPFKLEIAYLLRGGVQNATTSIDQIIMADYTNTKDNGKWNSAVSFTQIVFAFSAFIGGKMADQNDYRFIFSFATGFYITALSIYTSIIFLVKDEDKPFFLKRNTKNKAD